MATPLTDSINALTTYANEVTGASDATLSDAVHTLASGYGGGEDYLAQDIEGTLLTYSSDSVTSLRQNAFRGSNIERVTLPNCTNVGVYALRESHLKNVYASDFPSLSVVGGNSFLGAPIEFGVFVSTEEIGQGAFQSSQLKILDFGKLGITPFKIQGSAFSQCPMLNTLILRYNDVMPIVSTTPFNGTPFANGGSGGTIYVPSALIPAYKVAQNWSTIDGYGTVTWASIEGSIYEHQYADGTPIE